MVPRNRVIRKHASSHEFPKLFFLDSGGGGANADRWVSIAEGNSSDETFPIPAVFVRVYVPPDIVSARLISGIRPRGGRYLLSPG